MYPVTLGRGMGASASPISIKIGYQSSSHHRLDVRMHTLKHVLDCDWLLCNNGGNGEHLVVRALEFEASLGLLGHCDVVVERRRGRWRSLNKQACSTCTRFVLVFHFCQPRPNFFGWNLLHKLGQIGPNFLGLIIRIPSQNNLRMAMRMKVVWFSVKIRGFLVNRRQPKRGFAFYDHLSFFLLQAAFMIWYTFDYIKNTFIGLTLHTPRNK